MKHTLHFISAAAVALMLSACTGLGTGANAMGGDPVLSALTGSHNSSNTSSSGSGLGSGLLGNLLSTFLGGGSVKAADVVGTWTYQGTSCVFESENLLAKVGGTVAATKIEKQIDDNLAKMGIKSGASTFTFNNDGTYTATIGSKKLSGQYAIDSSSNRMTMTYLNGLGKMNATVAKSGRQLSLLFEADKLLSLASGIGSLTGKGSNLSTISSLLGNYDGMQIGLKLTK